MVNGHEAVDLGLSVMWASQDVGADNPYEVGPFFAWGATQSTKDFKPENEPFRGERGYTKYEVRRGIFFDTTDGKSRLEREDDAANANWGGTWRMPTKDEARELIERCRWEYIEGKGYKVTGPSGNFIFFAMKGDGLEYWTSDMNTVTGTQGKTLVMTPGRRLISIAFRNAGRPIRPVTPPAQNVRNGSELSPAAKAAVEFQEAFYDSIVKDDMDRFYGVDYGFGEFDSLETEEEWKEFNDAYEQWKRDFPDKWKVIKEFRQKQFAEGIALVTLDIADPE